MDNDSNGNPDVMRVEFSQTTEPRKEQIKAIKETMNELHAHFDELANDRHMALAKTHLEISCMMAVKSLTAPENQ